jgi:aryl-alcohol dehydrogenase-like predicted oxidoreductase
MSAVAAERGCTAAQLALAWLLSSPWRVMPIVATRRAAHIAENARALGIRLDAVEAERLAVAVPVDQISGARHPAEHMKTIEA